MLSSTHHVELNPSDAGFQDRYIVQEIIKEMARNRPIDTKGKKGYKGNCSFGMMVSYMDRLLLLPSNRWEVLHNNSLVVVVFFLSSHV